MLANLSILTADFAVMLAGLSKVQNNLIRDWIGPAAIIIIAGVAAALLFKRELRGLLVFLGIAAVATFLIFFGGSVFGKGGKAPKAVDNVLKTVTVVEDYEASSSPLD